MARWIALIICLVSFVSQARSFNEDVGRFTGKYSCIGLPVGAEILRSGEDLYLTIDGMSTRRLIYQGSNKFYDRTMSAAVKFDDIDANRFEVFINGQKYLFQRQNKRTPAGIEYLSN